MLGAIACKTNVGDLRNWSTPYKGYEDVVKRVDGLDSTYQVSKEFSPNGDSKSDRGDGMYTPRALRDLRLHEGIMGVLNKHRTRISFTTHPPKKKFHANTVLPWNLCLLRYPVSTKPAVRHGALLHSWVTL